MDSLTLAFSIPMAVFLTIFDFFLQKWFRILGIYLGIAQKTYEKGLIRLKLNHYLINILYNKDEWPKWRQMQHKDTKLDKFCDSCFRTTHYTISFILGLAIFVNRSWGFTLKECWAHTEFDFAIWALYVLSLAFYLLDFFEYLVFFKVKRDCWAMTAHHVGTIALLVLSWKAGASNIGSIVITINDGCDVIIDLFKAARYANMQKTVNFLFALFVVYWFVTRIVIAPFWILRHMLFDVLEVVPEFPWYYEINGLLCIMQCINYYWTYLIIKLIIKSFKLRKVEYDIKSDNEEEMS